MADPLPAVSLPVEGDGPEEHAAQTQVEGDAGHDEEGTVQAVAGQRQSHQRRQDECPDAASGEAHTDGKGPLLDEVPTHGHDTGRIR